jgi:hypothetical protein
MTNLNTLNKFNKLNIILQNILTKNIIFLKGNKIFAANKTSALFALLRKNNLFLKKVKSSFIQIIFEPMINMYNTNYIEKNKKSLVFGNIYYFQTEKLYIVFNIYFFLLNKLNMLSKSVGLILFCFKIKDQLLSPIKFVEIINVLENFKGKFLYCSFYFFFKNNIKFFLFFLNYCFFKGLYKNYHK